MRNTNSFLGSGIAKTSARPIKVVVDEHGEYWLCDAEFTGEPRDSGSNCLAHSNVPMAEGG